MTEFLDSGNSAVPVGGKIMFSTGKKKWNDEGNKFCYEYIMEDAKRAGFSSEELESPYLDKLSHQTKSKRILRMLKLAYYIGQLRGVLCVDGVLCLDELLSPVALD